MFTSYLSILIRYFDNARFFCLFEYFPKDLWILIISQVLVFQVILLITVMLIQMMFDIKFKLICPYFLPFTITGYREMESFSLALKVESNLVNNSYSQSVIT